ncbi:MAG: hypothetical protein K1060chlam2_00967 [Chlamydiae bacterium]|nr:hypothetical protein [Chlamydiota bacterium]
MADRREVIHDLREDLTTFHDDWEQLTKSERVAHDPAFLKKVAADIQKLDLDAKDAAQIAQLKECAQLLHFALTTPWGAPFVGTSTLLEAANSYRDDESNSSLQHLLTDFSHYGHEQQAPLLKVFEEILEELPSG